MMNVIMTTLSGGRAHLSALGGAGLLACGCGGILPPPVFIPNSRTGTVARPLPPQPTASQMFNKLTIYHDVNLKIKTSSFLYFLSAIQGSFKVIQAHSRRFKVKQF